MMLRYLVLAEAMRQEAERVATAATAFLRTGHQTTGRDRVLTALACKMDGTFGALVEDCRAERGEAMHHLKTMVEVFIYFYSVVADPTDRTANGLVAKCVADEHAKRLRVIEPGSDELRDWETFGHELRREAVAIGTLADLAGPLDGPLGRWYAHVYRLACQSAHLGDVLEWMPEEDGQLVVGEMAKTSIGRLRSSTAIYYAIEMMLSLFEAIATVNVAGLQIDTTPFRAEMRAIREAARRTDRPTGEPA